MSRFCRNQMKVGYIVLFFNVGELGPSKKMPCKNGNKSSYINYHISSQLDTFVTFYDVLQKCTVYSAWSGHKVYTIAIWNAKILHRMQLFKMLKMKVRLGHLMATVTLGASTVWWTGHLEALWFSETRMPRISEQ